MSIEQTTFGALPDGAEATLYTFRNSGGFTVKITNYGGIITELWVPGRDGQTANVVAGFSNLDQYLAGHPFFGAIIGRFANRIARGRFTLGGQEYVLAVNNGPNHLHGGLKGFDKKLWKAEPISGHDALKLTYRSPDGEEGYPGNLDVTVIYTVTEANELRIDYTAATDKPTVLNLTNHSYFNLAGSGDILGHELLIDADQFTSVDEGLIPTGEIATVKETSLDFTQPRKIGERIGALQPHPGGYDHNYVLRSRGGQLARAARVLEPGSGRVMEVFTTEPGMQFYSGINLDGSKKGVGGVVYNQFSAFCLETQHFPDSPNQPDFPSVILRPGQTFKSTTIYKF